MERLSEKIASVYRKYDPHPEPELDQDIYCKSYHPFFEAIAAEYAPMLALGTIVDKDERAKSLLRGMLKHISGLYPTETYSEELVDLHWKFERAVQTDDGLEIHRAKDDWLDMDYLIQQ